VSRSCPRRPLFLGRMTDATYIHLAALDALTETSDHASGREIREIRKNGIRAVRNAAPSAPLVMCEGRPSRMTRRCICGYGGQVATIRRRANTASALRPPVMQAGRNFAPIPLVFSWRTCSIIVTAADVLRVLSPATNRALGGEAAMVARTAAAPIIDGPVLTSLPRQVRYLVAVVSRPLQGASIAIKPIFVTPV